MDIDKESNALSTIEDKYKQLDSSGISAKDLIKPLNSLAEALLNYFDVSYHDESLETLLSKDTRFYHKKLIPFLIELIFRKPKILDEYPQIRIKIIKIFDEHLTKLYRKAEIRVKDDWAKKLACILDEKDEIERAICSNAPGDDLSRIRTYQKQFSSFQKKEFFNFIAKPFIAPILLSTDFNQLFDSIHAFYNNQSSTKVDNYHDLTHKLDKLLLIANQLSSRYCEIFLFGPFSAIKESVDNDFRQSPYSKNALLEVIPLEKKYPLSELEAETQITLEIKNLDKGVAKHVFLKILVDDNKVELKQSEHYLSYLSDSPSTLIREFPAIVKKKSESLTIYAEISWENINGIKNSHEYEFKIESQKLDINWDALSYEAPYNLNEVNTLKELAGRKELMKRLISKTRGPGNTNGIGSFIIYGHKRVGKTSIVKSLKNQLKSIIPGNHLVIDMEAGDFVDTHETKKTIDNFGRIICTKIKQSSEYLLDLKIPTIDGSFSNITTFLDKVINRIPELGILIIVDEFDEISPDLFQRGKVGDNLFLTIRAISNRLNFGFIFVGGEKMQFITSAQGEQLNKFDQKRIDHFDRKKEWSDYATLIKKPVEKYFDVTDKAIEALYDYTSGHPFFTKLICEHIYTSSVSKRHNFVSHLDVHNSVRQILESDEIGINRFQHYWEDGILEKAEREEEISVNRRKVLLSLVDAQKANNVEFAKEVEVLDKAMNRGISSGLCKEILREFVNRKVLLEKNESYCVSMKLFRMWLLEKGKEKVITTLTEADKLEAIKVKEEQDKVKPEEIKELIKNWPTYRGQKINTDDIRSWLNQFGEKDFHAQRLMFMLLQNIKFFNNAKIYPLLVDMHRDVVRQFVKRQIPKDIRLGKRKRDDIIVSFLENSVAKSGAEYARKYAKENDIYTENAIGPSDIESKLEGNSKIKAIVFIDDFIGTGSSIAKNYKKIASNYSDIFRKRNLIVCIEVMCGFQEGVSFLEKELEKYDHDIHIHCCNTLDESEKCFSKNSKVFHYPADRKHAKEIADSFGSRLVKMNPLGYGNCQALIVFPENCPNNSLPILWTAKEGWSPIFKRV